MSWSVVLVIAGIVWLAYRGYFIYQSMQAASWPTVEGEILDSDVRLRIHGGASWYDRFTWHDTDTTPETESWEVTVRYRYKVKERWYESRRLSFDRGKFSSEEDATEYRYRYRNGEKVQVHVDPRSPKEAVLDPNTKGHWMWSVVIGIGFFVAAYFFRDSG